MPNNIAYADIFQSELQKLYLQGSLTSWMENNAAGVEYNGGKYVYMPALTTDGLGDYSRTLGYPSGSIVTTNTPYELTKDRGRQFMIDAVDVDESKFVATAANVMSAFQRDKVVPEVDAYRISKIYADVNAGAAGNINSTAIDDELVMEALLADIAEIQDVAGEIPLVIMIRAAVRRLLPVDFTKSLDVINFSAGGVYTKVRSIDGNPLITVPSARMYSAITLLDGTTAGQEAGGFTPAGGASAINWIITPATAPIAIAKVDKPRIFEPSQNTRADAWLVDYRMYHDLWMTPTAYNVTIVNTGTIS
jgi:hypothetical protein